MKIEARRFFHAILVLTGLVCLAACGGGSSGRATPPPPPPPPGGTPPAIAAPLSIAYSQVKTLTFRWADVSDATFYRLLENPDGHSGFSQLGSDILPGVEEISQIVPLHRRASASYALESCNTNGCRSSASVAFSADSIAGIGYVKASNTDALDSFGRSVAVSADGRTLAVGAPAEDGAGLDGADNNRQSAGAVYVYQRGADGSWGSAFYIKASTVLTHIDEFDRFGSEIALSGDGGTLAISAPLERGSGRNLAGDPTDNSAINAGAVYVFDKDSSGAWISTPSYIKANNAEESDLFGGSLALSADGNTLAVGALGEDGGGRVASSNDKFNSGAVYVYSRSPGGGWSDAFYIKASTVENEIDVGDGFGRAVALSADGNTLAVGAPGESTADVNDRANNDARMSGAAYLFERDAAGIWQSSPTFLKASNLDEEDNFGRAIALSADGNTLAVGAPSEYSTAAGINGDQSNNDRPFVGAVYTFARDASGDWTDAPTYIKPSNPDYSLDFGAALSLSADGSVLAVGAIDESSDGTGINGNQDNNNSVDSGAAYVFGREGQIWSQLAYIKASNTEEEQGFGRSVALSGDGDLLAVGADGENSSATEIGGDQTDTSAANAGAVYLY